MKHEIACETSSEFARIVGNEKLDFAMRTADQRSRQTLGDIDSNRPMEAHRRLVECSPPRMMDVAGYLKPAWFGEHCKRRYYILWLALWSLHLNCSQPRRHDIQG